MNRRNFDVPSPSLINISAVVKWYNPTKGFGFVQPSDGSPDAFLHASVVEQSGHHQVAEGTTLICDIADGQKGPQVSEIHSVTGPSAASMPNRSFDSGGYGAGGAAPFEGTVKFFNTAKGFGFVKPSDGGKDVFVSARVLERAGLHELQSDQRVRITVRMGDKGPMAESIQLA